MRTLLTMLGIIIGVGAVIVMVAIGEGAQSQIRAQIDNLGTNMIVITPGSSSQGGVSQGAGSFNRLTMDDAEALQRESFLLSAVSPVIVAPTQIVGGAGQLARRGLRRRHRLPDHPRLAGQLGPLLRRERRALDAQGGGARQDRRRQLSSPARTRSASRSGCATCRSR